MEAKRKKDSRGFVSVRCPHCASKTTARRFETITPDIHFEIAYQCNDVECGYTFVAHLRAERTVTPSAKPNPAILLPVSSNSRKSRQLKLEQLDQLQDEIRKKILSSPYMSITKMCKWIREEHGLSVTTEVMAKKLSSLGLRFNRLEQRRVQLDRLEAVLIERFDHSPEQSLRELCQWAQAEHGIQVGLWTMRARLIKIGLKPPRQETAIRALSTPRRSRLLDGYEDILREKLSSDPDDSISQLCRWLWSQHKVHAGKTSVRVKLHELGLRTKKKQPSPLITNMRLKGWSREDVKI